MSSLPPLLPFNSLKCNTTFRGSIIRAIQENSLTVIDFTVASLFSPYAQIGACFKEVKVLKVKLWLVTTLSASSSGVISFCVSPKDLVNAKDSYANFSCTPGVMTRKSYQTLHGQYFPTEPDERNWFPIIGSQHLFTVQIFGKDLPKPSGTTTAVDVQIIWDAHLQFRGRMGQSAIVTSGEFEMIPTRMESMNLSS